MKFNCSKNELVQALSVVRTAIPVRTTMPILEGILIQTVKEDGKIKLTGYDLEIGIEYTIDADIFEEGSIVIENKIFNDIIRNYPEEEISIFVDEKDVVKIESLFSKCELKGLDAESFPVLPSVAPENTAVIKQGLLKEMIMQTIFAISTDENRKILTGSLIECNKNDITVVSLDNKKMALRKNVLEEGAELKVVVPGKTLREIVKIFDLSEEYVKVYVSNNQILFDLNECKITSRLLEGEFFNYSAIISKEYETKIKVDRKKLYDSVKRASLITSDESRFPIVFKLDGDRIIVNSNSNIGSVRDEIETVIEGKDFEIAFNPLFLLETLNSISDEYINVYFVTELGPCIIKPVEGEDFVYLIASVKV